MELDTRAVVEAGCALGLNHLTTVLRLEVPRRTVMRETFKSSVISRMLTTRRPRQAQKLLLPLLRSHWAI